LLLLIMKVARAAVAHIRMPMALAAHHRHHRRHALQAWSVILSLLRPSRL
jgi:hypothetical protein